MQSNSEASIEKQVDQNKYDEQEGISIKTKLNLPYYNSSSQFERAYGSITINGTNYQYVKRRVLNDTLELLCLPNAAKTKLESVNNELTKELADGQASTPKKNITIKITLPDFFQPFKNFTSPFLSIVRTKYFSFTDHALPAPYASRQERPPQSMQFIS